MKMSIIKTGISAALLFGSTLAFAHTIETADGDIEVEGDGYIVTSDGMAVKLGESGCARSGAFSEDNQINACEGIEEEVAAAEPEAEPEATTEAEPAAPEPTIVPVTNTIKADFATGSDVPTADGEAAIAGLISELKQYQEIVSIEVSGHTDSQGSAANNQALSERRAAAVASRLSAEFPSAQITSAGFGETQPRQSNDTAEGRAANRRVDVTINAKKVEG